MATPVDLRGSDPRAENEVLGTLAALEHDWAPIAPSRVTLTDTFLGENDAPISGAEAHDTMAQTDMRTGEIRIARRLANDYDTWHHDTLVGVRSHILHKGITRYPAAYTVTHEFGHLVARYILAGDGPWPEHPTTEQDEGVRRVQLHAWKALDPTVDLSRTDMVPMVDTMGWYNDRMASDLSTYATTAPMELWAEAFAVHRILGPGVSKVADAVTKVLTAAYHRRKAHEVVTL